MTAGSRLDPSLSMNNNDISPHARGRGRGRKGGLDHGRVRAAPRQSPLPRRVSRAERPVLMYVC
jgi:hypothetical protein